MPATEKCKDSEHTAIDTTEDTNKCIIALEKNAVHCPLETGCTVEWSSEQSKSKSFGTGAEVGAGKGVVEGSVSAEGSWESSSSKSSSTQGRLAYGATNCNFYEVTKGKNFKEDDSDFNCRGPIAFTTCNKLCTKLVKCKDMNALQCNAQYMTLFTSLLAIYLTAYI